MHRPAVEFIVDSRKKKQKPRADVIAFVPGALVLDEKANAALGPFPFLPPPKGGVGSSGKAGVPVRDVSGSSGRLTATIASPPGRSQHPKRSAL